MTKTQAGYAAGDTTSTPLRVSIQGYAGAFHEVAARHCFQNQPLEIVPAHTFEDLVGMVEAQEEADIGLMAIENTLAGSIMRNYTLLQQSGLHITGEVFLRIKQNLMVLPGVRIEELREVHSHPMAIAQCREFFTQYPNIRLVETVDTALSAREISENGWSHIGAIASTLAAEMYGLEIIAPGIETNKKNHTRFLVLEKGTPKLDAALEKVSISFATDHEVGSLYKALAVMAAYNVNLTKIQSAPIIGHPWEYQFYVDFVVQGKVGHEQALDAIRPLTRNLQVHGVYACGEHYEY
ncbi:MAG: prephenate dehydratase [Phaeodactylibacter xiamenensis]|uniref:prephenate dehydratase n=1 Tax=Phaeodactylibacter xiamenensis TaxID=1524460 RepID=UPI0005C6A84D|nr:prephenate dehydratase [Phaeodactylibacter xiamenensis]MCR9054853.1 prephenate dehydratase [bacterium]